MKRTPIYVRLYCQYWAYNPSTGESQTYEKFEYITRHYTTERGKRRVLANALKRAAVLVSRDQGRNREWGYEVLETRFG